MWDLLWIRYIYNRTGETKPIRTRVPHLAARFQSLGLAVVHRFLSALKTGTESEAWNRRTNPFWCWIEKLGYLVTSPCWITMVLSGQCTVPICNDMYQSPVWWVQDGAGSPKNPMIDYQWLSCSPAKCDNLVCQGASSRKVREGAQIHWVNGCITYQPHEL